MRGEVFLATGFYCLRVVLLCVLIHHFKAGGLDGGSYIGEGRFTGKACLTFFKINGNLADRIQTLKRLNDRGNAVAAAHSLYFYGSHPYFIFIMGEDQFRHSWKSGLNALIMVQRFRAILARLMHRASSRKRQVD